MADDTNRTDEQLDVVEELEEQAQEHDAGDELERLQDELAQSRAREQRLMADYQNLIRRNREEQTRWAKLATKDFVSEILLPLEHLTRAAEQVQDKGLDMVMQQFWQTLERHGVQRVSTVGQKFDVQTMEAVEQHQDSLDVTAEVRPGFTLYGEVIQHAKVILGQAATQASDQAAKKKN